MKKRIEIDQFDKGLWVVGPKDRTPKGYVRRGRGLHAIPEGIIRSRCGTTTILNLSVHSAFRFGDRRFFGSGTTLYRNGAILLSGLTGNRLSFVRMPPTSGQVDYLFVAGGGLLRKVDDAGAVTRWGIVAPVDDPDTALPTFTATVNSPRTRAIEDFEDATDFTASAGVTLADEATIKQFGTNSLKMDVTTATIGTATAAVGVNLATYADTTVSPDGDLIDFHVRVDNSQNVDYIVVRFDVASGDFATDYYQHKFFPRGTSASQTLVPGVGNVLATETDVFSADSEEASSELAESVGESAPGTDAYGAASATWTRLRIPKRLFERSGSGGGTWANVAGLQLMVKTNAGGAATVYFDRMRLFGSTGLEGRYRYRITYENSTTGSHSNGNPQFLEVSNVERQSVTLVTLPVSSDPQVDRKGIWRTIGNGTRFFKIGTVPNATTTFTDRVADYAGLGNPDDTIMTSEELTEDNQPPEATYNNAWGPWQGRMWWTRDSAAGARGRVYYSPAGRAEAVEDFIDITDDDNPTQCGVVWNGVSWVFTESHMFRINGSGPYTATEVFGVPGTTAPFSVVPTPYGIIYRAHDGIRVFTGNQSTLVFPMSLQPIFRGAIREGLGPFEPIVATYANDEYFCSDGTITLAINLDTGTWRDLGVGCTALYTEPDSGLIIASFNDIVGIFEGEVEGSDGGTPIPFDVEVPLGLVFVEPIVVNRVYVDAAVGGQQVTLNVLIDNQILTKGPMADVARRVYEYQVDQEGRVISLRFTGALTGEVEIHHIWLDVDIPTVVDG